MMRTACSTAVVASLLLASGVPIAQGEEGPAFENPAVFAKDEAAADCSFFRFEGSGNGNGNGNGNIGSGNGNWNQGSNNGNRNVGSNNGNANLTDNNGNDGLGDGRGNQVLKCLMADPRFRRFLSPDPL